MSSDAPQSEPDTPDPQPASDPTEVPATAEPAQAGGGRRWPWRLIGPRDDQGPPKPASTAPPVVVRPASLLRHSPFALGFFATFGGITAIGLWQALSDLKLIILLVVVSLFLALGLNPLVEWLVARGLRRSLAVAVVTLGGLGVLALGSTAVFPLVTLQLEQLYERAPGLIRALRDNPQIAQLDRQYHFLERATSFLASGDLLNTLFGGLLGAGRYVANAVFSLIVTLVLTIYFLASLENIKNVIYQLSPASKRPRARYIADQMFRQIGGYLTGMFIVVTIAASCAFIFMLIVGLGQYALALAFVVAVFAFIPLVGSTMSMITVALVGFTISPTVGIATIVYFLVYQQFDAYVIQPRVMSKQVNVPGAVVVLAALAGGTLLGIIGALIAVPTAAALLLLYREVVLPNLDAR